MVPLGAEILTERVSSDERGAVRRTLRLGVQAHSAGDVAMALILNISETGLLIETVVKLDVGETLHIDIPEASASAVRVVWTERLLAGCEFVKPVATSAVSAAQLRASIAPANAMDESPAGDAERQSRADLYDGDEATFHRTIVLISALISVVALIIFLAAVVPL